MLRTIILLLALFSFLSAQSQTFTDSNLPIVIINTDLDLDTHLPLPIPDDPRVLASMKIIQRPANARNYLTDQNTASLLNYNGR
ncbi:MAG TPA: hypothetical protein VK476_03015, partial [Flavobacterium sp.]|nr:hypothetical protein [Flavobacterium sp.]